MTQSSMLFHNSVDFLAILMILMRFSLKSFHKRRTLFAVFKMCKTLAVVLFFFVFLKTLTFLDYSQLNLKFLFIVKVYTKIGLNIFEVSRSELFVMFIYGLIVTKIVDS